MKKGLKIIVDITMVIALVAAIGFAAYLFLGSANSGEAELNEGGNVQSNPTIVTRRGQ